MLSAAAVFIVVPAKPIDPQPEEELPDAVLEEAENSDETTAADTPVIPAETVTVSMLLRGELGGTHMMNLPTLLAETCSLSSRSFFVCSVLTGFD